MAISTAVALPPARHEETAANHEHALEVVGSESFDAIARVLDAVRTHLDVDVAYIGEFLGGAEVVRHIAGDGSSAGLEQGATLPLEPISLDRPLVAAPIRFSNGHLYGTLCAVGGNAEPLHTRDERFLRVLAALIAETLEGQETEAKQRRTCVERIRRVIEGRHRLAIVLQPIVDLSSGAVVGCEALARFRFPPLRTPDRWFAEAWQVGLGMELERTALRAALAHLPQLGDDMYISINVSPEVIVSPTLEETIPEAAAERVVLELTEHVPVDDYESLTVAIERHRRRGTRLAIDDTGAGFASLRHILRLRPDIVKLDVSLTRGLDGDRMRWALSEALLHFGRKIGAGIIAEGVESRSDLRTLQIIGFQYGQGRALHSPHAPPIPDAINLEEA